MSDFFDNKNIHSDKSVSTRTVGNPNTQNTKVIFIGKVISIEDDLESMRIKVRIPEFDNNINDSDLVTCYPIYGQILRIFPKVGEAVTVMLSDSKNPYNDRFWIAPIIRTFTQLKKDPNNEGNAFNAISGYFEKYLKSVKPFLSNPNSKGILNDKNNVSIVGRENSDINLGTNSLLLRINYTETNEPSVLNSKNPAYIFLNNNPTTKQNTIVHRADNILLISHDGNPNFKSIMDEKEIEDAIKKCHSLPYGDVLVNVLKLIVKSIVNHYHPYPSKPPIKEDYINSLIDFNLNSILSKNIKIN